MSEPFGSNVGFALVWRVLFREMRKKEMVFWKRDKKKPKAEAQAPVRADGPPALAHVKHIIAIASGKGGVGKSTLTANLAVALKHTGAKVALMDADIYGASQPGMFGADATKTRLQVEDNMLKPVKKHGIDFVSMGLLMGGDDGPVVWRAPMVTKLLQQFIGQVAWGEQDYLLIDLPPGTGDIQLTLAQRAQLSGAVIVTTPQQVAMGIAEKGMRMFEQVNVPILGVIENMSGYVCEHCGKKTAIFKEGGGVEMANQAEVPFLGAVPLDREIMESGDAGTPVLESSKDSVAAKAFIALAEAIKQNVEDVAADPYMPKDLGLDDEGNFRIIWPDGMDHTYAPYDLRVECGCALCVDEDTGKRTLDPSRIPLDIQISNFTKTGRYAITFAFSDGHNTGIYTYKKLKDVLANQGQGETFSV